MTAKAASYAGSLDLAVPYLLSRGITREAAAMFNLGYVTEGQFAGRLSIPYMTPAGCVNIKFRRADSDGDSPKYLYEAGTSTHLFNAQVLLHAADKVVVTEGELDAICVQAYTGIPAVAYPGVETWKKRPHWRLCFEGISDVIVVADGDDVGKEAARKVAESIGLSARVVEMPKGSDANDFIASQGAQAFIERIK